MSRSVATRTQPAATAIVPAGFEALPAAVATGRATTNDAYIFFASKKSGQWDSIAARVPGLVDGDPVYVAPDFAERLPVLNYHLASALQYWARIDPATGNPASGVVYEQPEKNDKSRKEFIDAVLLAQTTRGCLPARCRFKSGLIGGVLPAIAELTAVADLTAWASRSAGHAAASKLPVGASYLRFVASASFGVKTAKGSGFQYLNGRCACRPVNPDDLAAMKTLATPETMALCALVAEEHNKRIAEIKKLPA